MTLAAANIFNVALILLENLMLFILADAFFVRKRTDFFVNFSFLLFALCLCATLYFVGAYIPFKLLSPLAFWTIWIFLCYETSFIRCSFPVLFWLAYLAIGDNISLSVLSSLLGKNFRDFMLDPNRYYFICFSAKIAELFGIVIIFTWVKRHLAREHTSFQDWFRILTFPLLTLIVSIYLFRIYIISPDIAYELTVCNVIILVLDIASIFVMNYLETQQKAVRDNIILRQNMKAALDNVEAWKKAYDGQRKLTHDFQNQLLVIHGMVEQAAPTAEILRYIERLQTIEPPGISPIKTRRLVVDIILNQKFAIAKSRSIPFTVQLDDLSAFPLNDEDLVTVLSNLIDNAIEACEKIEDPQARLISLKMKVEPQAAFLYIENTTAEPVRIQNNRILSSKKNPLEHGYGLQNILSVLNRNHALYLLNYDSETHVFSFSAQIAT